MGAMESKSVSRTPRDSLSIINMQATPRAINSKKRAQERRATKLAELQRLKGELRVVEQDLRSVQVLDISK